MAGASLASKQAVKDFNNQRSEENFSTQKYQREAIVEVSCEETNITVVLLLVSLLKPKLVNIS